MGREVVLGGSDDEDGASGIHSQAVMRSHSFGHTTQKHAVSIQRLCWVESRCFRFDVCLSLP
jgi:hypothetical protein